MSKSKKILKTSLDLTPLLKTSVDICVEGLVPNVDYLENQRHNFIQKKFDRKRRLQRTNFLFSQLYFSFLYRRFTLLMSPKGKKE